MCFWRCDRFESILCKEDDCRAAGRGCRWQLSVWRPQQKHAVSRYKHSVTLYCNLSIDRERVATWQPNTPLLVFWCFVVDQSSFNKPVLGTIVRGLTEGIDRVSYLMFIIASDLRSHCDDISFYACDRAKDFQCVSATFCVLPKRTCFTL